MFARYLLATVALIALGSSAYGQKVVRTKDVIYGRKSGLALTMDVFTPPNPNGTGVILCVSFGFESTPDAINKIHPFATGPFLNRGYTVFAVVHGSQPKFTVPEIVDDMHRAVRFIKANARAYKVDPDRLGIAGGSSGGHLALMMGCAWKPGNPAAEDPVEQQSSKVGAVACFFPVTDFRPFEAVPPEGFEPTVLFPFRERDPKTPGKFVTVTSDRRRAIGDACSPLHCAGWGCAPVRIVHGDADELVPLRQSKDLHAWLTAYGGKPDLVIVKGMRHSLAQALPHLPTLVEWFDQHLLGGN